MMEFMIKPKLLFPMAVVLMLTSSACLKTRAQIKDEPEERGVSAKIQDVQPQGQYVIDEIKSEITRMSGRIEDLERAGKEANTSSVNREEFKKMENRIMELEQAQANLIEAFKKAPAPGSHTDPIELFDKGKAQFEEKDYEAAAETLGNYLKAPKAKAAVERAAFFRGESYYHLKQYKKAIVDFSKIIENFPRSKQAPLATLRIGQSFEALGMKEEARSFYQELAEKYPKSTEAKKVRNRLK
ncbi:MAG TPA: hypothetical protein DCS07_01710 [Bdellovibrionales bacterium]|nr:MAG: hypothetical protein A2Z97_15385 [Bdellovibrionales bacterium GWB1_52_6]OFZ03957.1 MAG: hypothetical protein A2X97_08475 [Bdellovibrionales bacterium GWA1_52_35]OFZ37653.1 MAG: hypothetical protein A2070_00715 [Bdellovibrionales bacterium GWC1_52_8]HAR41340.1 hypothetical protein [Bdellovibrionales bacterium]HCM39770.1 hypothetical protein [Bdellovibrionales bacterium]